VAHVVVTQNSVQSCLHGHDTVVEILSLFGRGWFFADFQYFILVASSSTSAVVAAMVAVQG